MADLGSMSDEELMQIAGVSGGSSVSDMSDDDLMQIAGIKSPVVDTSPTWGQSAEYVGKSLLEGGAHTLDFLNNINPFSSTNALVRQQGQSASPAMDALKYWGMSPDTVGVGGTTADVVRGAMNASALPVGGALGAISNALSGTGAVVADKVFPDSYEIPYIGKIAPLLGGLAGGIAPSAAKAGIKTVVSPFTSSGQQAMAGKDLLFNAGKEGRTNIAAALDNGVTANEFGPRTYAELADSPSAAAYQTAVRKIPGEGANAIEAALVGTEAAPGRQLLRQQALQEIAPDAMQGITAETRGLSMQPQLIDDTKAAWTTAKEAYKNIPDVGDAVIPFGNAQTAIGTKYSDLFDNSSLSINADTKKILDALDSGSLPYNKLLGAREDIGATIGAVASANPKAKELPLLYQMKTSVDDAVNQAIDSGSGLTKEAVDALKTAREGYRQTGAIYGSPLVKNVTKRGDYGNIEWGKAPSTIPKTVIKSPESAKQFMAAFGENAELVTQAKGTLVDEMTKIKDPSAWVNFYEKNKSQFGHIFKDDAATVEKVIDSLAGEKRVAELASRASKGQSFTSQGVTVAAKMLTDGPRMLTKLLSSKVGSAAATGGGAILGGGWVGAVAGYGAAKVAKSIENNIEGLVARAMVDPDLLKVLSQKATESSMKAAGERLLPILGSMGINALANPPQEGSKPQESQARSASLPASENDAPTPATSQPKSSKQLINSAMDRAEAKMGKVSIGITENTPEAEVIKAIDSDPYTSALFEAESGRDPKAQNPESTAGGGFQFVNKTAKAVGLRDKFNLGASLVAVDKLTDENRKRFGDDPALLYSAHYLGGTVLGKLVSGKTLTPKEQAQVDYLEKKALPRFMRIYGKVSSRFGQVTA